MSVIELSDRLEGIGKNADGASRLGEGSSLVSPSLLFDAMDNLLSPELSRIYKLKFTLTVLSTFTGSPFLVVGVNFHCRIESSVLGDQGLLLAAD